MKYKSKGNIIISWRCIFYSGEVARSRN